VMEARADGFLVGENARSDHLPHIRCDHLPRCSPRLPVSC
jgi:hypothetical protein